MGAACTCRSAAGQQASWPLTVHSLSQRALWLLSVSLPVYTKLDWGLPLVWSLSELNCAGPGSTKKPSVLGYCTPTLGCCCCVGWLLQVCAHIGRLNYACCPVMVHLNGLVGHGKSCNVLRPAPHTAALTHDRAKLPSSSCCKQHPQLPSASHWVLCVCHSTRSLTLATCKNSCTRLNPPHMLSSPQDAAPHPATPN